MRSERENSSRERRQEGIKRALRLSLENFLQRTQENVAPDSEEEDRDPQEVFFHLDLLTATSDTLSQEPPSSPPDSVFLYKKTHDRRGTTRTACRLAARLQHMTEIESKSSYMEPKNTEMHFRGVQNDTKG